MERGVEMSNKAEAERRNYFRKSAPHFEASSQPYTFQTLNEQSTHTHAVGRYHCDVIEIGLRYIFKRTLCVIGCEPHS